MPNPLQLNWRKRLCVVLNKGSLKGFNGLKKQNSQEKKHHCKHKLNIVLKGKMHQCELKFPLKGKMHRCELTFPLKGKVYLRGFKLTFQLKRKVDQCYHKF